MAPEAIPEHTQRLLDFLDASPSPFHAVLSVQQRLEMAGFERIQEHVSWSDTVRAGGKYFLTRNASTIVAFKVGLGWKPGGQIAMVGTHTDSPCLRLKPISRRVSDGYLQFGVECYGDGLWHTWFDRDLSVAGKVLVRRPDGAIDHCLVRIMQPILRIPTLAVHFGKAKPFDFNLEDHLYPIAGVVPDDDPKKPTNSDANQNAAHAPLGEITRRHDPSLIALIAQHVQSGLDDILDFELVLYDTQTAQVGGMNNELLFSSRLDNLVMTHCALEGLIQSTTSLLSAEEDCTIRLVGCFDHEEIGSRSAHGADSNILPSLIQRLCSLDFEGTNAKLQNPTSLYDQSLLRSFLISADMEHAVHPNYSSSSEAQHRSRMNAGTVLKVNANMRYATDSPGIVLLQECARLARGVDFQSSNRKAGGGVPLQLSVVRNDGLCGSTIGPVLAAKLGVRTIDVGNCQLGMHSIRETAGCRDVEYSTSLFESFFTHFGELQARVFVD